MNSGDSHIVRPGSWFPICGTEPNGNVTLPADKVQDPSVMDAVEICPDCLAKLKQIKGNAG